MKYFIATDIHGSAYWAQKVVQKFAESQADVLVLLGDIYNHGPRNPLPKQYEPLKVAELLNPFASKMIVVQGNCDSEVDQMISDFLFVRENFVFVGNKRILFTHGHVHNKTNTANLSQGDVIVYGHFHVNEITTANGINCVNLTSCALPKNNSTPAYAILDDNGITLYDFSDVQIASLVF